MTLPAELRKWLKATAEIAQTPGADPEAFMDLVGKGASSFLKGHGDVGEVVYDVSGYCPPEPDNCALDSEDSGAALIFHLHTFANAEDAAAQKFVEEPEYGMFVRIQSYDERVWPQKGADPNAHDEFKRIMGKRVRVTVEVLDD